MGVSPGFIKTGIEPTTQGGSSGTRKPPALARLWGAIGGLFFFKSPGREAED
jgi:hypothetical protein